MLYSEIFFRIQRNRSNCIHLEKENWYKSETFEFQDWNGNLNLINSVKELHFWYLLEELEQDHFRDLEKLETLKFTPLSIGRKPRSIFTHEITNLPNLKNLILNRVALDEFTLKGFCNLESLSLTDVIFSERMSIDIFKNFKNLKEFYLSFLNFRSYQQDKVIKDILRNIEVKSVFLECLHNSVVKIFSDPVSFFEKIKCVKILFENDFPNIKNFFLNLSEDLLNKIEISFNNFDSFPEFDEEILRKIKNINALTLSNRMRRTNWKTLEKSISNFSNLKTLSMINIENNFILNEFCFESLINLEELSIENTFRVIDHDAKNLFRNLDKLKRLKITGMNIGILKSNYLDYLINLEELELSSNRIQVIEAGSFKHINKLEILDLSANLLEKVNKDTFNGLNNLKKLNLTRNIKIEINSDDLEEMNRLECFKPFEMIQFKTTVIMRT